MTLVVWCDKLGGVVGVEEGGVHGLQAGGAGEGPLEPVVDAVGVVEVHAGQVPHPLPLDEIHHADHTPAQQIHST